MDKLIENKISSYLKSQSRNKIVFYKDNIFDFPAIDVGNLLAQAIFNLKDESKLPMRVSAKLDLILNAAIIDNKSYGKILAISNIGILLEQDLKQDFNRLLENYSNSNALFVHWNGDIDEEYLYFLTKEQGEKINIKNLSHITL